MTADNIINMDPKLLHQYKAIVIKQKEALDKWKEYSEKLNKEIVNLKKTIEQLQNELDQNKCKVLPFQTKTPLTGELD